MSNNTIEEIQELVQQIKNEYQEEVDYKSFTDEIDKENEKRGTRWIDILSPRLKKYCREKFNFPLSFNDYLDYQKGDERGNWFVYQTHKDTAKDGDHDLILSLKEGQQNKPKNCAVCGKLAIKENGRMRLWDGEKDIGGPFPNVIAYFHPECAKKYFAEKEQPTENNARIKEKLLRNLDKICLDPMGELANAELLKQKGTEKNYNTNNYANTKDKSKPSYDNYEKWLKKVHTVEIEGGKIWLSDYSSTSIGSLGYQEVKKALMQEIKQNPSEWEITEQEEDKEECEGGNYIIKHKSGRRHWDGGFYRFWGITNEYEKMGKEWDKIKSSLKGYKTPTGKKKINDTELENLKRIFKEHNIRKITFENGKLTIEYDNKINSLKNEVNNQQFQELKKYCREHNKHEIDQQSLGINSNANNSSANSGQNKDDHQLAIGLVVGASVVLAVGILVYLIRKKRKK